MTQLEQARQGAASPAMIQAAGTDGILVDNLMKAMAQGEAVLPASRRRAGSASTPVRWVGIGRGLSIKVNANIGTSTAQPEIERERDKVRAAVEAGADTLMDLSTAGNLDDIRRMVLSRSGLPVGTVPIYQTAARVVGRGGVVARMNAEEMWDVVAGQAEDGVDFMTIHAGLTQGALERLKKQGRLMDIVSRGGSFLAAWMVHQQKENPFYEGFDRLLDLARKHDVTLSLGDGLRPGCLADATDRAQIQELIVLGELADRARAAGVQVMIEGPGHVPLDQVQMNVQLAKTICRGAPLYVLGPLVTDAAAGWDHVAAAIGGAVAGMAGADFLCYVTPSEHLRLPDAADVRAGVIAARIAAHAADLARGNPQAWDRDRRMSTARRSRDWPGQIELALDSFTAASLHEAGGSSQDGVCAMCGPYCALKIVDECLHPQTPPERG